MKIIPSLIVFVAAFPITWANLLEEYLLKNHFDICKDQLHLDATQDEFEDRLISEDQNAKCLILCLLTQEEIFNDDGEFNPEGARIWIEKKYSNDGEIEVAMNIGRECFESDHLDKALDQCEAALQFMLCVSEHFPDMNLIVEVKESDVEEEEENDEEEEEEEYQFYDFNSTRDEL